MRSRPFAGSDVPVLIGDSANTSATGLLRSSRTNSTNARSSRDYPSIGLITSLSLSSWMRGANPSRGGADLTATSMSMLVSLFVLRARMRCIFHSRIASRCRQARATPGKISSSKVDGAVIETPCSLTGRWRHVDITLCLPRVIVRLGRCNAFLAGMRNPGYTVRSRSPHVKRRYSQSKREGR